MTIKDNTIMRAIDRRRQQAKALHGYALQLMDTPGRERDANNVSKEASIADAEIEKMVSHCAQWNDGAAQEQAAARNAAECDSRAAEIAARSPQVMNEGGPCMGPEWE